MLVFHTLPLEWTSLEVTNRSESPHVELMDADVAV